MKELYCNFARLMLHSNHGNAKRSRSLKTIYTVAKWLRWRRCVYATRKGERPMTHIMHVPVLNERSDEFRDVENVKKTISDHLDDALINLVMCHGNAAAINRSGNIITVNINGYNFRVFPVYAGKDQ
jgi:hypothetical protein